MKSKPTEAQIADEIAVLKELEPKVRPFSVFSDDNRAAIQAQIQVLTERLNENQVYDVYGEEAFEDDGLDDFDQHILDNALEAQAWLAGDSDVPPGAGWLGFVE